ncbi:hypothetical protein M378DRAFT_156082 [Amanita muscaria Koide BX008]|uniref:WD40 repeat-like protein n=1 Tax=Amanita muscaria (strain Koide BX008) TaxID=946122 RepID=A0A0C2TRY7_AMAMK|nr:hypothetical protein M378DRAFT_156082 [Amanita muscaria Koide BX008]
MPVSDNTTYCSRPWLLPDIYHYPPSFQINEKFRRLNHSQALQKPLDRVNVLGTEDGSYGHTGCVNALSWAENGQLLLSGGDDLTIRLWRMDQSNVAQEYPFVCRAVIHTGHRANIFNIAQLPYTGNIVSVAADRQVRITDAETVLSASAFEKDHNLHSGSIRVLRCHRGRVKRLATEESPDVFLTVAEDGTVRQHDLRTHHICDEDSCPAPLVKLNHELSTISMSPLTPYQFIVAGDSPYGYLFDRRHVGRFFLEEWGAVPRAGDDLTTCVRRFGRPPKLRNRRNRMRDHITGVRVSPRNGHEVLLTYSGDGVYLYSTNDEPRCNDSSMSSPLLSLPWQAEDTETAPGNESWDTPAEDASEDGDPDEYQLDDNDDDGLATSIVIDDPPAADESDFLPEVSVVFPRMRYAGAQNIATIKDVNFVGPNDEFVASGSDDGNFFLWRKNSGKLQGIYEGDGSIVNVIEGHPHLPLLAVSGIDTTVKLFAPSRGGSTFSRTPDAERIIARNARRNRPLSYSFATVLAEALNSDGASLTTQCPNQ